MISKNAPVTFIDGLCYHTIQKYKCRTRFIEDYKKIVDLKGTTQVLSQVRSRTKGLSW